MGPPDGAAPNRTACGTGHSSNVAAAKVLLAPMPAWHSRHTLFLVLPITMMASTCRVLDAAEQRALHSLIDQWHRAPQAAPLALVPASSPWCCMWRAWLSLLASQAKMLQRHHTLMCPLMVQAKMLQRYHTLMCPLMVQAKMLQQHHTLMCPLMVQAKMLQRHHTLLAENTRQASSKAHTTRHWHVRL